ncbi:PREDICTED: inactive receptor-like serine/threonine-protein kinase At2g40270 isoform X2 [Populus euphratica]|uniref:Inactive receptor-like serine/threonine-protein kinase At2g40270 isoform X2 n=1 Tax=Populus euphratica TaxID=75702 RepID=A0AAJ6SZC9_POPEU|nr:PREDICTED: inactive receptor-like serine/threonine-protein kinase At2g40270 isoform X2 [Populus euphratica]
MEINNWKISRFGVLILFLVYQNLILCFSLNDEGMALLKLREGIVSDPYGALKSWKMDFGVINPCSWFGVECSSDGKVVVLNLKDLCLEGTLAPEITNLVHIKSIILRNNSFSGIIPEGVGELKALEVLDFGYNNFSGPLPPDLGSNPSLAILLLDNNERLRSLSSEIQHLETLSEFQVDENELSNAAKGSSRNKRSITWNLVRIENAVHRRQLHKKPKNKHVTSRLPSRTFPPPPPKESTAPSTRDPSAPPIRKPTGNFSSLNGSTPPSISAPALSDSSAPRTSSEYSQSKKHHGAIITGTIGGTLVILISILGIYICKTNKASVKPWATGLSGQLQKAFVTGVPKLKRSELEAGCEDFSNVIGSSPIGTLYKGTLSSGVEIAVLAVASVAITSAKDWSKNLEVQFRQKIETLSKVNHKNFVNLIGYCEEEEPFTRMMVFEYAPNGTLFEHLHIKESEHLDWGMRLRIAMGMAYCLEHMHQLNPPIAHSNLTSSVISLTEDYASKISDFTFSNDIIANEMELSGKKLPDMPLALPESNVYNFGVLLFEMVTGRLPYSVDNVSLEDWASDYLRGYQPLREKVDPTLDSFEEEKLERIGEVIKSCVHPDPKQRPTMREVTGRLREITTLTPDAAIPKLSPLWWAELEILSTEAS